MHVEYWAEQQKVRSEKQTAVLMPVKWGSEFYSRYKRKPLESFRGVILCLDFKMIKALSLVQKKREGPGKKPYAVSTFTR